MLSTLAGTDEELKKDDAILGAAELV